MKKRGRGKQIVFTKGEIADIKRRVKAGESYNSVLLDHSTHSVWTIRFASQGQYDDIATDDTAPPLTTDRIKKLLAFPTPEQAYADHEIHKIGRGSTLLLWLQGT